MEEFDDLVDGQGHVVRVLEGVVGPFDGNEFDDVVFSEFPDEVDGNHFILRAVEDEDVVGKIEVFVVADVEALQIIHKCLVDFHLAFETDLDFLALLQFGKAFVGDMVAHAFIHVDAWAAQGDFPERISYFEDVAQGEISAEAGGIVVKEFRAQRVFCVVCDQGQIGHAFGNGQLFAGVFAVAGPVKGDDGKIFILRRQLFGKVGRAGRVFAAAEAVGDDGHVVEPALRFMAVMHEEPAADAVAFFVDIKMFFHGDASFLWIRLYDVRP